MEKEERGVSKSPTFPHPSPVSSPSCTCSFTATALGSPRGHWGEEHDGSGGCEQPARRLCESWPVRTETLSKCPLLNTAGQQWLPPSLPSPAKSVIHVEPVNYLSKPQKERHPVRASSTLPLATKGSPKLRSWSKHGLWWFSALRAKKRQ